MKKVFPLWLITLFILISNLIFGCDVVIDSATNISVDMEVCHPGSRHWKRRMY